MAGKSCLSNTAGWLLGFLSYPKQPFISQCGNDGVIRIVCKISPFKVRIGCPRVGRPSAIINPQNGGGVRTKDRLCRLSGVRIRGQGSFSCGSMAQVSLRIGISHIRRKAHTRFSGGRAHTKASSYPAAVLYAMLLHLTSEAHVESHQHPQPKSVRDQVPTRPTHRLYTCHLHCATRSRLLALIKISAFQRHCVVSNNLRNLCMELLPSKIALKLLVGACGGGGAVIPRVARDQTKSVS